MKNWWARVILPSGGGGYGRWIPTGCQEKAAAKDYIMAYHIGEGFTVLEWLQL